jgi:hypothetical protein
MLNADLLDEQVVWQQGRFQRIRRWWRGIHPEKGTITQGLTGWETVEEKDLIVPLRVFTVGQQEPDLAYSELLGDAAAS